MTGPAMTNWTVTYNNHSDAGAVLAAKLDVCAAYYDTKGHLIEFKDSTHQVVFAIHAGITLMVSRADAATQDEAAA